MKQLQQALSTIHASRVLDVATRTGDFAFKLADGLASYGELIAVDINETAMEKGKGKIGDRKQLHFEKQDCYHTTFPDHHFDVIGISNSLHHFADLDGLFAEIKRILAPNGTVIINEMTSDNQDGAAGTHYQLHAWDCVVDTAKGVFHGANFTNAEVHAIVEQQGFTITQSFTDVETNPALVPPLVKRIEAMEEKADSAKHTNKYPEIVATKDQIKAYYQENGIARAKQYVLICG